MTKQQAEPECVAISGPRGSISIPLNALSGDEGKDYELIAALAEVICGPSEVDDDETEDPSVPRPPRVSPAAPAASTSTAPTVEKAEPGYEYQWRYRNSPVDQRSEWSEWHALPPQGWSRGLRDQLDLGRDVNVQHPSGLTEQYRRVKKEAEAETEWREVYECRRMTNGRWDGWAPFLPSAPGPITALVDAGYEVRLSQDGEVYEYRKAGAE